ncbi:MAG TPA: hypothetical protein VH109_12875 [Steroidobacteraceae bacterium]|nr:hypothetical protein [Steroidobacteraceae bacterium]
MIAGICFAVLSLAVAVWVVWTSPRPLLAPLIVYLGFYLATSVVGATALAFRDIRLLWSLMYPGLDERWMDFGNTFGYWFMVWGPLLVSTLVARASYAALRRAAFRVSGYFRERVDILPTMLVGGAMCAYCVFILAQHGYLGTSLLSSENTGLYKLNIQQRAAMFRELGTLYFAAIYTCLPALAVIAFYQAVRRRDYHWWLGFALLSAALVFFYLSALTKSNVLIYGLELTVAAQALRLIRIRGALAAAGAGTLILSALSYLLAGTSPLDVLLSGYNIVFREASDIPFYLAVFPSQIPFVGLDLGLGGFGIGPTVPANEVVSNFMWPKEHYVQGAAPAAAHVMAYAEGGFIWATITMALVGVWIAFTGALRSAATNPLVFSGYIGAVAVCYYLSQAGLVGVFVVAYGYRWWLATLILLIFAQRFLARAVPSETEERVWTKPPPANI